MNPYEILEVRPGATADEVKASYHRLAKQWHPDRFSGEQKAAAEQKFRQLSEAFNMLKGALPKVADPVPAAPIPAASVPGAPRYTQRLGLPEKTRMGGMDTSGA